MQRSLLDTDTFSEILRGRNEVAQQNTDAYLSVFGRFCITVISVSEVIDGFRRQRRDDRIARFIVDIKDEKHEILFLGLEAAVRAGYIFGDLYRSGQAIGAADPFIAAVAITEGIPLVTGNVQNYERVQALGYALELETWHGRP